VQDHCDVVVVEPVTVAENVWTVPAITIAVLGETVTTIVFGLELLQPFCQNIAPANISIAAVFIVRHFMNDISLIRSTQAITHARNFKSCSLAPMA
jgi:hypothetical protein